MNASPNVIKMLDLLEKTYASKRVARCIAILTSLFSKRKNENRDMSRFIDEFNHSFSQLAAMGEDARIPNSLKSPILLASFGTSSSSERV